MKVIKHENEFGLIISFQELDKQFDVSFSDNGDLYWTIRSENVNDDNNFIITKENYEVYRLFEELFDDIENIKIFDDEEYITFYLKTEKEKQEYIKNQKDEIEYEKINIDYSIFQIIMNYLIKKIILLHGIQMKPIMKLLIS